MILANRSGSEIIFIRLFHYVVSHTAVVAYFKTYGVCLEELGIAMGTLSHCRRFSLSNRIVYFLNENKMSSLCGLLLDLVLTIFF